MATTPLSQAILQGMDPGVYRPLSDLDTGNALAAQGMDSSPTSKWGALGRLAQALSGAYLTNSATSDLAKTIGAGKKSAADLWIQRQTPAAPPQSAPLAPPVQTVPGPQASSGPGPQTSPFPQNTQPSLPAVAPQAPVPGSANEAVANRFPGGSPAMQSAQAQITPPVMQALADGAAPGAGNDAVAAIEAAAAKHGVKPDTLHKIAAIESDNNPDAVNPNSSAKGLFQFTNATAKQYGLSDPKDAGASADAAARLLLDNQKSLKQALGRDPTDAELYLAHQQGAGGAAKLLANPNANAVALLGRDAVLNNGGTPDMTAGQFAQKWTSKFDNAPDGTGGASPVRLAQANIRPGVASDAAPPGAADASEGLGVSELLQVLHHPYASEEEKALASKLLLQKLTPKEDEFASSPQGIFNKRTGELKQGQGGAAGDYGGLQGKDLLEAVQKNNPAVASQVTAIIEGRAPYPTGSRLNPVQQQVKELVTQIDPTFEVGNTGARIKVRNEFNGGGPSSPAAAITSGNTAIQHLGHLSNEAEKLGNFDSGIPGNNWINEAKNAIARNAGGGVAASNFDSIRNKYIEEATKFYRGTGGNEADLQRDIAALNSAQSPSQLRDVIKTQADLMQSKINALQERWKHGMGPLVEDFPIIHPESQAAIYRINQRQAGKSVDDEGKPLSDAASSKPATTNGASADRAAIEAEMRKRGLLQ